MATVSLDQEPFVRISPGRYWIGDDSSPNASPKHLITLEKPVWIDRFPVRLSDLESAVVRGGFRPGYPASGSSFRSEVLNSVDGAVRSARIVSLQSFASSNKRPAKPSSLPACGLLWQEAVDVCGFFGARLPTEQEWEIAMCGIKPPAVQTSHTGPLGTASQLGCVGFLGHVEEWTASEWTQRYWVDSGIHVANEPTSGSRMSVRGCLPMGQVASLHGRFAASPTDAARPRIFRRVWQQSPDAFLTR
jgi:formylglycine-generating enzyme required for sulfatase activity